MNKPFSTPARVCIGTAGWSIPREFPDQYHGAGSHLERYARTFQCAEINSSFYKPHRVSTWQRWADSVPTEFQFSVKAPKAITHAAGLEVTEAQFDPFLEEVSILGPKLGPILFQLPPKLAWNSRLASSFLARLRARFTGSVVFEPRHASWFTPEAGQIFREFSVARVAADPPRTPEAAVPGGSSHLIYYRLHGTPRTYYSSYSEEFLATLATGILAQHGLRAEVWCIFDNTASGAALGNAHHLQHLTDTANINARAPY